MDIHKIFSVFVLLMVAMAAMTVGAYAERDVTECSASTGFEVLSVEVNGHELSDVDGEYDVVTRNDDLEVEVTFKGAEDVSYEKVRMEATLRSTDVRVDDANAETDLFDVHVNARDTKSVEFPLDFRSEKSEISSNPLYWLEVEFNNFGEETVLCYEVRYALSIDAENNELRIARVDVSPSQVVQAGSALFVDVRVENVGDNDQDKGVTVTAEIPGVAKDSTDLSDLNSEELETTESLWLQVPACTPEGSYDMLVTAEYRHGTESVTQKVPVRVLASPACNLNDDDEEQPAVPKTVVVTSVAPQTVAVRGQAGFYPLTITNNGNAAETYVVTAEGYSSFATAVVNPSSLVVVQPRQTVMLQVALNGLETAAEGQHPFTVSVKSASGDFMESVPMVADVVVPAEEVEASSFGLKRGLEIGLIVLFAVILLLVLVVGFNKLRGSDDDFEEDDQTYY